MNSCNFIGRLVNDPKVRKDKFGEGEGEEIVCSCYFNLAVDRISSKGKQSYDVLPIKAVGAIAETCEKWLVKGKRIAIAARAEHTKYQKDGKWYEHLIFKVQQLFFLDPKGNQEPNAVSNVINQVEFDTSGLEEAEYQGINYSSLD